MNVAVVAPGAMVAPGGTAAIAALLLETAMPAPPAGAGPLSTTVPIETPPPEMLVGLRLTDDTGGGVTVRMAVRVTPAYIPRIVTSVVAATGVVEIVNVAVVAPASSHRLAGTAATAVLLLKSTTLIPPPGAGALRVTVPADAPAVTLLGVRLTEERVVPAVRVSAASLMEPP